jgi:hypothetical protein
MRAIVVPICSAHPGVFFLHAEAAKCGCGVAAAGLGMQVFDGKKCMRCQLTWGERDPESQPVYGRLCLEAKG